jgi:hypothetical protein
VLAALDALVELADGTVAEIYGHNAMSIIARRLFGRELPPE